jgi:hypothetical protein
MRASGLDTSSAEKVLAELERKLFETRLRRDVVLAGRGSEGEDSRG